MIDDAATRVNASAGGATSDALEDHDRDLARRPLLIFVVRRPDRGHRRPESRLLGRRRRAGARLEAVRHDLHLDDRLSHEIVVPARVSRRAAARGDDEITIASTAVDQRGRPWVTRAPAGRGQEQGRDALPDMAVAALSLDVPARVRLLPSGRSTAGSGSCCRHGFLRSPYLIESGDTARPTRPASEIA